MPLTLYARALSFLRSTVSVTESEKAREFEDEEEEDDVFLLFVRGLLHKVGGTVNLNWDAE